MALLGTKRADGVSAIELLNDIRLSKTKLMIEKAL